MGQKRTDLLRGTLDLLVLKALSLEPLHGVGISGRITQITKGAFQVSFGSLFSSTTSHGGKRLGRSRLALVRQQPPRKILPLDFRWARSAQG
jgi:DNA-binding PadR family transcriptional regulator